MVKKLPGKGFTIIEIIISISVISLLVGLSYASYATFTQREKLITAGQSLKNVLRDVESRSFNSEVDCSVCNCTDPFNNTLDRWYVDLSSRLFYGVCGGNSFEQTLIDLPSDIILESSIGLIEFIFRPPSVNEDVNICLSLDGLPGRFYRIEVKKSGDISDSGGLISSCTP